MSDRLGRTELEQILRAKGFTTREAKRGVQAVFDRLAQALARGEEIEIGGCNLQACETSDQTRRLQFPKGTLRNQRRPARPRFMKRPKLYISTRPAMTFPGEGEDGYVEEIPVDRRHRVPAVPAGGDADLPEQNKRRSRVSPKP